MTEAGEEARPDQEWLREEWERAHYDMNAALEMWERILPVKKKPARDDERGIEELW